MGPLGTISAEDIYGAGSLDTIGGQSVASLETSQKTNPNNSEATGQVKPGEQHIFGLKGNILGQPIIVWAGFVALLVALKFIMEKKG